MTSADDRAGDPGPMGRPDPDPATTPGLEPGSGTAPGDTPPGESSTSGSSYHEPDAASRRVNWALAAGVAVFALLIAVLFVAQGFGPR